MFLLGLILLHTFGSRPSEPGAYCLQTIARYCAWMSYLRTTIMGLRSDVALNMGMRACTLVVLGAGVWYWHVYCHETTSSAAVLVITHIQTAYVICAYSE